MREFGELRIVAEQKHVLRLIAELMNNREQPICRGRETSRSSTTMSLSLLGSSSAMISAVVVVEGAPG